MAIDQKYVELINADIDGEISVAERADLQAFLDADPEAREMHAELEQFCGELSAMKQIEPPPHLKYALMQSFQGPQAKPPPSEALWRQVVAMPLFRHAAAFAAGVFMTFALISSNQLSDSAFDDVTGLVGTISENSGSLSLYDSIELASNEIAGTVRVLRSGDLAVVDFNLSAAGPVEIVAGFEERDLWFKGFAQLENDNASVAADHGKVTMHMQGRNRYAMYLQLAGRVDATINLKFFADGILVHEANLVLGNAGVGID